MRIPILLFSITILFCFLIDFYIFKATKNRCKSKVPSRIQLWSALALYLLLLAGTLTPMRTGDSNVLIIKMWLLFSYFTTFIPKAIFVLFDILASALKLIHKKRWSFISIIGGIAAFTSFCMMWWGAMINRLDVNVKPVTVEIQNLPEAFDEYRIVQISDLHVGSYADEDYINRLVAFINKLKPDLIVFTGDIVNRKTDELNPFIKSLSNLSAGDGVVSILGNHDYGDYYNWESDSAKEQSLRKMIDTQREMGWNLLLNEHIMLRHGSDSIAIIGVENVGDPPFKIYGDLNASYPDLSDDVVKILLSHNPIHWKNEIANNDSINIALTLSGHTHAMQTELFGLSPASVRYEKWGGMYEDNSKQHKLYVNIGIGTVAFPMRLGATPEVTLFTLTRQ